MALTRRTARFGELAAAADAELERRGAHVPAAEVDRALNARVEHSAALLGIEPRAALRYAPPELPVWLADELEPAAEPRAAVAGADVIDLDAWKRGKPGQDIS